MVEEISNMSDNLGDFTVVVAGYGDDSWRQLAESRALPSAAAQPHVSAPRKSFGNIHVHLPDGTLAEARNAGLDLVESEYVIFLDADDELGQGYVEAMTHGAADLRAPAVKYGNNPARIPRVAGHLHGGPCTSTCLYDGNWLVIGTCARTELMRKAGGWQEEELYEDWALFSRMLKLGATVEAIENAVYLVHPRIGSRNTVDPAKAVRVTNAIRGAVWG